MGQARMNVKFFTNRFVGKDFDECQAVCKSLLEGNMRNGQAAIAFTALKEKFGKFVGQEVKEIQADHDAIKKERKTGATVPYLAKLFGISQEKVKEILKGKKTVIPLIQKKEVKVDDAIDAFDELMQKAIEADTEVLGPIVPEESKEVETEEEIETPEVPEEPVKKVIRRRRPAVKIEENVE